MSNDWTSLSRRRLGQLLAAGAAAGVAVRAGVARAATGPLRVRLGSDVSVLDPARIFQVENQTVAGNIYSGLVRYDDATNKIVPDLASSWTVSPDGTSYEFKLRSGVTWHKNYGPFTSDDVKFSFERVKDPATSSMYAGQIGIVKAVEAPDPQTVRITLAHANAGFLHKVAAFNQGWIVSRKAVNEIGDQRYKMQPVGTGPFVFERWTPGSEVRLSANKAYYAGAPKVDGVVFRVVKDETAAATALENGELDVFFALQQPEVIERLRKDSGVTVIDRAADHTINLVLNTQAKPLGDVRVRQAIAYGIDRDGLIKGYFKGTKLPAFNVLTPSIPEYTTDVPKYPYDPDKAKALLKEAGAEGFTLDLVSVAFHPYDKIVVPIAADLGKIGIKASIKVLERGAYLQARSKGDIMTAVTGVVGPPDPDNPIDSLYSRKSWPPGLNTSHYAGVEDLLDKVSTTQDAAARLDLYHRILAKTMADIPVIPLYADRLFMAHGKRVQGLVQNSMFTFNAYPISLAG